jgi:hypothetical protein
VSVRTEVFTHPLQVHALHRFVHALDDAAHAVCDCPHCHGSFNATRHCVNARRQAEEVETLGLLPDRVLGIDARTLGVALLERLHVRQ